MTSCYYHGEDARLFEVGDNFVVAAGDSLVLQTGQPLYGQPDESLSPSVCVYPGEAVVVAEVAIVPEDAEDSVWVKLARDQYTMGWTHKREFTEGVVPDDPISQFIHLFSTRHLGFFIFLFALSTLALLYQVFNRRKPRVFFLRDILSAYPTMLVIMLAISALLYASIQHYVPETWMLYYYHPTLNPFGLPPVLSLFLCSVWTLLVLSIATVDEVRRQLPPLEAFLYLLSLLGCCILVYLLFTLAAYSPGASYTLFALFVLVLLLRYFRHAHPRYTCGNCGARLAQLGRCPHCGAENQ